MVDLLMQNLILTHNNMVYAVASLTSLTLGSFYVCSHVYERWLKKFKFSLMDVNVLVKGLIVLLGFSIISPNTLINGNPIIQLSSLLLGCLIGYLFLRFETFAIKLFPYQKKFNVSAESNLNTSKLYNIRNTLNKKINTVLPNKNNYSYFSTGIVGVFEELLFRGFLTVLCFSLSDFNLYVICLVLINCIFALSHINLGYLHIATKFILGFMCLISFLLVGSIFVSIAIHASFNLMAVKKLRELQYA